MGVRHCCSPSSNLSQYYLSEGLTTIAMQAVRHATHMLTSTADILLFDTGTMSEDSSVFSCLPVEVRNSILRQAFQQLDQRHLFGVAPRVCRLWRQLSLSIIVSLVAKIRTVKAAQQLALWIQKHGAGLETMEFHFDEYLWSRNASAYLMSSFQAAENLRSLSLSADGHPMSLDVPLPTFSCLTTLSICWCHPNGTMLKSMLNLTQLSSLSLSNIRTGGRVGKHGSGKWKWKWEPFMEELAADLSELTSLDFSGIGMDIDALAHLHELPKLKQLCVGNVTAANELSQLVGLPITSINIIVDPETVDYVSDWLLDAAGSLQELSLLNQTSEGLVPARSIPLHKAVQLKSFTGFYVELSIAHLASLTQLTSLDLKVCGLDDAAVCRLSSLSNLKELVLSGNPGFTGSQGSVEVLATSMPQLTSLKICSDMLAYDAACLAFGQRVVKADAVWGKMILRPLSVAEL